MSQIKFATAIKRATPDLANEISDLVNSAYRGESGTKGWTSESDILTGLRTDAIRVRELIETADNFVLVKVIDGRIVGCVHLEKKDSTTAYLGMLTTDPRAQAKGTGSELLKAAEEYAKKFWMTEKIEMTVIDSRLELIAFYVRRGYRVTNEKRPFPSDPRFGVPLVGPIEFVVLEKAI
jgi:N-acetylglutamate synthase-like GNAT family acetyltransferase